ncbi:MAG: CRTAC1 family protein [Planctomycetota bacterium]
MVTISALSAMLVNVIACRREQPEPPAPAPPSVADGPIVLRDVSSDSGMDAKHTDGSDGRRFIIEPMCAGMALLDYDNDGLIDVYVLNGAPHAGSDIEEQPRNRLYRNLGNLRFQDVTLASGAGNQEFGLGVTAADFDNDGYQDIYLNNSGPNALLKNNGDGTFSDITGPAGVGNKERVGAGAAFFDMDADGDLDLYAANYLEFDPEEHVQRNVRGYPSYPSPRDFRPIPDSLFRNNGDGTFADVSQESGVASHAGTGMGMVVADVDDDGHMDVFVLNDVAENFFFRNDGKGNFEEVGLLVGLAYNGFGEENASMGVDCGDVNNDGLLDFYMTSYQAEFPVFYRNLGEGRFEDATQETQAGAGLHPWVNWGIGLVDFDCDGDLDCFVANGHTEDNVDMYDSTTSYRAPNTVLLNTGGGRFKNVSKQCGDGLEPVHASRGAAFNDLDNDGDVDVVVLNSRERPTVLRNDSNAEAETKAHWVQLKLIGVESNRDGVGSRVTVTAGDLTRVAEVHSGRGYQSHYAMRLHFGLGTRDTIDRLGIRWAGSGTVDTFENIKTDRLHHVIEGRGLRR